MASISGLPNDMRGGATAHLLMFIKVVWGWPRGYDANVRVRLSLGQDIPIAAARDDSVIQQHSKTAQRSAH